MIKRCPLLYVVIAETEVPHRDRRAEGDGQVAQAGFARAVGG